MKKFWYVFFGIIMVCAFIFSVVDDNYFCSHKLSIEYPFLFLLFIGLLFIILNEKLHNYLKDITKIKIGDVEVDRQIDNVKMHLNLLEGDVNKMELIRRINDINVAVNTKFNEIFPLDKENRAVAEKINILAETGKINFNVLLAYKDLISVIEKMLCNQKIKKKKLDKVILNSDTLISRFK